VRPSPVFNSKISTFYLNYGTENPNWEIGPICAILKINGQELKILLDLTLE
jgi:hypothetical protein